jgi:uncharacterized protein (DUF2141 family)
MMTTPFSPRCDARPRRIGAALAIGMASLLVAMPAAAQYKQELRNDARRCEPGSGPAIAIRVEGVKASSGNVRIQSYRGTSADWLQKGRWLSRIEMPARAGSMMFCMPVPAAGNYAIAVRHDVNANGETDISTDGGAMSNNPSINIFNLGRPSVGKTAFAVGNGVKMIRVQMKYL